MSSQQQPGGEKSARLLLADSHRLFRQALRELIEHRTSFEVVGEAASGAETLELAEALRPTIILLDIDMPDLDGGALTRQIARRHPDIRVIVLTTRRQDRLLFESINAGARAYLLKDAGADDLIAALGRVARGEAAIDPAVTLRVLDELRRLSADREPELLTDRERTILQLIAAGYDNRSIGARLHLSEKTIGNRLSEIFQKLRVSNRTQAALLAVQRGLIPPPEAGGEGA